MKRTRIDEVEAQRALKQRPADELPLFSGEPSSEPAVRQVKVAGHTRTIEGTPAPVVVMTEEERKLEERFQTFHSQNPHVYAEIERRALELYNNGTTRIGVKRIIEAMRYEMASRTEGEKYHLNNSYTSRYARMLIEQRHELADVIETRRLLSA